MMPRLLEAWEHTKIITDVPSPFDTGVVGNLHLQIYDPDKHSRKSEGLLRLYRSEEFFQALPKAILTGIVVPSYKVEGVHSWNRRCVYMKPNFVSQLGIRIRDLDPNIARVITDIVHIVVDWPKNPEENTPWLQSKGCIASAVTYFLCTP